MEAAFGVLLQAVTPDGPLDKVVAMLVHPAGLSGVTMTRAVNPCAYTEHVAARSTAAALAADAGEAVTPAEGLVPAADPGEAVTPAEAPVQPEGLALAADGVGPNAQPLIPTLIATAKK
jgi:hypothetical protein